MEVVFFLFRILPQWMIEVFSRPLGNVVFIAHQRRRRLALGNLRRALGNELSDDEIRAVARRNFIHVARVAFEIARFPLFWGKMEQVVRVDDDSSLAQAVQRGKGVLLLVSHLGNWAFGAARVVAGGYPMVMVVRRPSNRLARSITERIGERMGIEMVARQRGMRGILRALRKGKVVLVALDQHTKENSVVVDFFGRPASTSTVLAVLSLKHGIPVVPAFVWREGKYYRGVYPPEVPISRTGDLERDIRENTQTFTRMIEEQVRAHPDQWLWMHRRWRLD
jgi:KDO2-lipid IV(A) lauroyltransferase